MTKLCQLPSGLSTGYGKVACIKAFRSITGVSLLDAKNAVEAVAEGEIVDIPGEINFANFTQEIEILRANGMVLTGNDTKVNFILRSMKANAKMAIDAEAHDLAIVILDALQRYKDKQ